MVPSLYLQSQHLSDHSSIVNIIMSALSPLLGKVSYPRLPGIRIDIFGQTLFHLAQVTIMQRYLRANMNTQGPLRPRLRVSLLPLQASFHLPGPRVRVGGICMAKGLLPERKKWSHFCSLPHLPPQHHATPC